MPGVSEGASRIEVRDLTKTYGHGRDGAVPAVDQVSFEVRDGQFVALIGPSGCGKSTILNMIAGLIPVTGGEVAVSAGTLNEVVTSQYIGKAMMTRIRKVIR